MQAPRAMARPRKDPATPSPLVPPVVRYVRAQGGRADALIARFTLPDDVEALEEVPLALEDVGALLEEAAREVGDPALGVRLPGALELKRYGLAELAARASPTLKDALERVAKYGALVGAQHAYGLSVGAGEVDFTHRLLGHPRGVGRTLNEYALAWALALAREQTGRAVTPKRVWFIHPRPRDLTPLEAFFGTAELDFGRAENGLTLDAELLEAPLVARDARLLATAEHLAERELRERQPAQDFVGQVAARLKEQVAAGSASARTVARALRMSSRTLQRRLEEEGTRFSEVLDAVREDLARRYMADPELPLAEVAYRLGFSDVGTFSRAFKRWTGSAPGAFRRGA